MKTHLLRLPFYIYIYLYMYTQTRTDINRWLKPALRARKIFYIYYYTNTNSLKKNWLALLQAESGKSEPLLIQEDSSMKTEDCLHFHVTEGQNINPFPYIDNQILTQVASGLNGISSMT